MASMQKNILKYSALVFAGGASYGIMATTVKFALADGFQWTQVAASQPLFGTLLFAVALAVLRACGRTPRASLPPRRAAPAGTRPDHLRCLRALQLRAHEAVRGRGHHAVVPIHLG